MKVFRSRLLIGLLVLVLGVGGYLSVRILREKRAWRIVEQQAGLEVHYRGVPSLIARLPWQRLPRFRWPGWLPVPEDKLEIGETFITRELKDPERLAWALHELGPVEYLQLAGVEPERALVFLRAMGKQPAVASLAFLQVPLGEEITRIFADFPNVRWVEMSETGYTFEHLPELPQLLAVDITNCPLDEAGLRNILRRPGLQALSIDGNSHLSLELLRSIPRWRTPALNHIELRNLGFSESECDQLEAELQRSCPGALIRVFPPYR